MRKEVVDFRVLFTLPEAGPLIVAGVSTPVASVIVIF